MKEFDIKTKIYFGQDSLDRLKAMPYQRVMIIADPFVVSSGMVQHAVRRLQAAGKTYSIYSDVVPDPPIEKVVAGIGAALQFRPEVIVAIGGGSAIDLSKSVRKFARYVDPTFSARLIAVPTTSGTGSEVTCFAVITDPEKNVKYPLTSDDLVPDEAILDEVLVKSVPASVTADTGMDVMTHALEAYVSIQNNEFSGAFAEKAVEICGQFLLRSQADNNDTHARRKMHVASCLAGLAFNASSLGLNHGMAHQLGAVFHIPHGRANSILLPHIIEYNSEINLYSRSKSSYAPCVQKYCNMARILGVNNLNEVVTVHALINQVRFMATEMHMPTRVSEALPKLTKEEYEAQISLMAKNALQDGCTATNPRIPTEDDVIELYKKIW